MNELIDLLSMMARGGGGGSSGGGGDGGILVLPIAAILAILAWWGRKKRIERANKLQSIAESTDSTWSDEVIESRVREVFYSFQEDWANLDTKKIKAYLTPRYFAHVRLMLKALKQMERANFMNNVRLDSTALFDVKDHIDNELDRFDIEIKASMDDMLVDLKTKDVIYTDSTPFTEVWHFEREGKNWALDAISQSDNAEVALFGKRVELAGTEIATDEEQKTGRGKAAKAISFAQANNFFYNADFGWLLMPRGGLLFSDSDFKASDINHHVIGEYRDVLVQFFEYIPYSRAKRSFWSQLKTIYYHRTTAPQFVIAAATLPRDYGNIIVLRKKLFSSLKPSGLVQVQTESLDFNKKYVVFASDMDKVNSLELLHPSYIERLQDFPFTINIEIKNNTLYLYTADESADYHQMMSILHEAFEEMKR